MSDKKKKVFVSKDSTTPRRPVILKSDREPPKDQSKEKQEKEKQPTIILKTREQSAPKEERPQSPKGKAAAESEGIHPSKIAQNENKEKKEHKPSPPLKLMTEPVKLLDENLEFNNAALEFLHDSNTNYLVVGIIGHQGVGKSMIMNLIAQNTFTPELCNYILHSHEMPADNAFDMNEVSALETQMEAMDFGTRKSQEKTDIDFKFKMQDMEQMERGVPCTKGVDMYVTCDRVVLLDAGAAALSAEGLQLAAFLMAACHVLVAVQDWFTDYNFIRYIQAAEMLKPSLSASSAAAQDAAEAAAAGDSQPHLLLLHNRCQLEDFTPESVKVMQDLYRKAFQKSNLQLQSGMYMYSDCNRNGLGGQFPGLSAAACGPPINLFLLPEIYTDYDNPDIYRGHPPFEQLAARLRWLVLGRHAAAAPARPERAWLHHCTKAWETIRKCTFFMEYERFLP